MSDEIRTEEASVSSSQRPLNNRATESLGGIKVFGFKSRIATDDFVLPAWIIFLSRIMLITATLAIMVYSMQIIKLGPSCIKLHSLDIYMPTMVALMSSNAVLNLLLALHSAKGVIWDPNVRTRRFVSPLFHVSLLLGLAEIILGKENMENSQCLT